MPSRHRIETEDLIRITSDYGLSWEQLAGKTVLVTGASGFLPSYMVETLVFLNETRGLGIQIIALVRSQKNFEKRFSHCLDHPSLGCVVQDISQPLETSQRVDYVIHAASQASPKYYSLDPIGTLSANTLGTAALLKHSLACGAEGFLFFSSGEVYGQPEQIPTAEHQYGLVDPLSVRSCYAESKRMGENMCVSWHHQTGLKTSIVRPFHTYGPRMLLDDGRVYADFVANVIAGKSITLTSDGLARRAFCYLADAVAGFWTVLLRGQAGHAYNVGNPAGETSMRDLASLLVDMYPEKNLCVQFSKPAESGAYFVSPLTRNCPDVGKIAQIGWVPKTSLQEGFRRTIDSYAWQDA